MLGDFDVKWMQGLYEPTRQVLDPCVFGAERIPDHSRLLFVANHGLFASDSSVLWLETERRTGLRLRPLADSFNFNSAVSQRVMEWWGAVEADPLNCAELMEAGEPILVYPGGAREAFHHKGEHYQLIWGQRSGFAKLAVQHDYTIVPVATVGNDDAWTLVLDSREIYESALGKALRRFNLVDRLDMIPPVVRGIGWTPLPRPNRIYLWYGDPILPGTFADSTGAAAQIGAVRDATKRAIETGLQVLLDFRSSDPKRTISVRLLTRLLRTLEALNRRDLGIRR